MSFSIIVAIDEKGGIGIGGKLPWDLKVDMAHFKKTTTNGKNAVIMGRKTWESIPINRRPLENRLNIVLTKGVYDDEERTRLFGVAVLAQSLDDALALAQGADKVFVIGGANVYKEAIDHPLCKEICLTRVYGSDVKCDTFFPPILEGPNHWMLSKSSAEVVDRSLLVCLFQTYTQSNEEEMNYLNLVKEIIQTGEKRVDRTCVGTLSVFGKQMRFSLQNNTIPLLTTKKVFFKAIVEELLWFISGKTDAKILSQKGVHIWDGNGSKEFLAKRGFPDREEGDLGPVYGFQWRHFGAKYVDHKTNYDKKGVDQLQNCVDTIKSDPSSRRILLSAWNASDLDLMALPPCHVLCQFFVSNGELSCSVYQRSCDVGLGMPFNIASYALLTHLIASVTNLKAKELVFTTGDTHVYSDHVDGLTTQAARFPMRFPTVAIEKRERIDDFVSRDIKLINYTPHPSISLKMAI